MVLVKTMIKIGKLLKEKAGVSPIIAIILMVAITVVLAATIYVWVSGFGGGGAQQQSVALQQTDHGVNYTKYIITGAEGFLWSDAIVKVGGSVVNFSATIGGANSTGPALAGDNIYFYEDGVSDWAVGDDVLIIDADSNKIIYDTQIGTA